MAINPVESLWNERVFPLIQSETARPLHPELSARIKSLVTQRTDLPLALAVVFQHREERDLMVPKISLIDRNRRRVNGLMSLYFTPISFVHIAILQSIEGMNPVAEANRTVPGLFPDAITQAQMHVNAARVKQLYEEDNSGFSTLDFFLQNQQFQEIRQTLPFPDVIRRLELVAADRYRALYRQLSS